MINIPNALTLLRIALIPVFILAFYLPFPHHRWAATLIFGFAASTDWLDGYLARLLKQTSAFGRFLDPVADKLVVATALVVVVGHAYGHWITLPAAVIIGREITVSALREWTAEVGRQLSLRVSSLAKIKTGMQMAAVVILLVSATPGWENWFLLGAILLYAAALLTLWSMYLYLKAVWPSFRSGSQET